MAIIIGGGSGNAISINSTVGTAGSAITSDGTNAYWATKGISNVTSQTFVAPGTWTKPSTVVAIKVTVVGGGGSGGGIVPSNGGNGGGGGGTAIRYLQAPAIPGPVAVTAGAGTNSFGAFASATAGAVGAPGTPGGNGGVGSSGNINIGGSDGYISSGASGGAGGSSTMGGGGVNSSAGGNYGGGGSSGGAGAPGIVIVEVYS